MNMANDINVTQGWMAQPQPAVRKARHYMAQRRHVYANEQSNPTYDLHAMYTNAPQQRMRTKLMNMKMQ